MVVCVCGCVCVCESERESEAAKQGSVRMKEEGERQAE